MTQPDQSETYALLESVDTSGALASAYANESLWRVSRAAPTPGSLTERDREDIVVHDDMEAAVTAFFDMMRSQGLTGVLDTPELRVWENTPLDFTQRLTEELHDQADEIDEADARDDDWDNMPISPLREAMVEACPEYNGENPNHSP